MSLRAMVSVAVSVLLLGASAVGGAVLNAPTSASPGSGESFQWIADRCPTFSWGLVEGTESYEVVVYRLLGDETTEADPAVRHLVRGAASSWTPSLGQCLEAGHQYAWSVRATGGKTRSDWSRPRFFGVVSDDPVARIEEALADLKKLSNDEPSPVARRSSRQPTMQATAQDLPSPFGKQPRDVIPIFYTVEMGSEAGPAVDAWSLGHPGLRGFSTASYGVKGESSVGYGGFFGSDNDSFDLVLGGSIGRVNTDPALSSSDLVLSSNDDVTVRLDNDGGESGELRVLDSGGTTVASISEAGDLHVTGGLRGDLGPDNGSPFPSPAYDSGWISIPRAFTTHTHNAGGSVEDYVVDMWCKSASAAVGISHADHSGADGAVWLNLTSSSILLRRFGDDDTCPQVRVRIWIVR
jgi:hypothetical protein